MHSVRVTRSLRRRAGPILVLLLAALGVSLGCANGEFRPKDPFDRKQTFNEAQHRYTVLVRFSEFQKAKAFVAEQDRDQFMLDMKAFKNAYFTDYEADEVDLDDEKNSATVSVTYTLYLPSSPYEMQVVETQEWSRDGMGNTWTVRSRFEGLPKMAAN